MEDLTGYVRLKIRVSEDSVWRYTADGRMCTAAGVRVSGAGCLCATAPMGALLGKLGGSNVDDTSSGAAAPAAGASPTDQANAALAALAAANVAPAATAGGSTSSGTFPVGTYCVIPVPAGYTGPLFLTMNDRPAGFENHGGSLAVEIRGIANHRAA